MSGRDLVRRHAVLRRSCVRFCLLLLATVVKSLCIYTQDVLVGSVVELTIMSVRKQCFRRALELDLQTLSHKGTPDVMSRFTFDMSQLAHGLHLGGLGNCGNFLVIPGDLNQYGLGGDIVVPQVMMDGLEMPGHFSRLDRERDH